MIRVLKYSFLILFIVFSACENNDYSIDQSKHFVKFFGSYSLDYGYDVEVVDNGYVITGSKTTISKGEDIAVIKTDKFGNTEWEKNYGGNYDDVGHSIHKEPDGGYVLLATTSDSTNDKNILLLKLNDEGAKIWEKSFGDSYNNRGSALLILSDGYLILGNTESPNNGTNNPAGNQDILLIKTDYDGNKIWSSTYGGNGDDFGNDLLVTKNSYLIVGSTNSFQGNNQGNNNILLIKSSLSGGLTDMAIHGGLSNDYGNAICAHGDGYVICGTTNSFAQNSSDLYLVKLEEDLRSVVWSQSVGDQGAEEGMDVLSHNNEIIAVGSNEITGGVAGLFVKTDAMGNKLEENNYGGMGNQVNNAVKPTSHNGFVSVGSSTFEQNSMIVLTKTKNDGKLNK